MNSIIIIQEMDCTFFLPFHFEIQSTFKMFEI
jgi:hypothetical protein